MFPISEAKQAFIKLRQTFVEALISNHFNLECHIQIEMDVSGYAIGAIINQLTLNNLSQWHLVAFFSKKIILAETWYKTHDSELLAIIKAFKT